jgi:hypothetical protein
MKRFLRKCNHFIALNLKAITSLPTHGCFQLAYVKISIPKESRFITP